MTRRSRRIRWPIRAALLIFLTAGALWIARPRHQLLERATRIAALPAPANPHYTWRPDGRLLAARLRKAHLVAEMNVRAGVGTGWGRSPSPSFQVIWPDVCISPDSNWALVYDSLGGSPAFVAAALDGSRSAKRIAAQDAFWIGDELQTLASDPIWFPDSRQWAVLLAGEQGLYAAVQSLDSPGVIRKVAIGYPPGTTGGIGPTRARLLGFVGPDRVLATPSEAGYPNGGPDRKISFFEFRVGGSTANVRQYVIRLPRAGGMYDGDMLGPWEEVAVSPRGDRLAWIVHIRKDPPRLLRWIGRWLPFVNPGSRSVIELRTSRLDGSDVHAIGCMEARGQTEWLAHPHVLRWLPDGRRLSFVYKDALYTVPAD